MDHSPAMPPYLHLLVCVVAQSRIVRRLHMRFTSGDESYNFMSSNGVFVGAFSPEAVAEARAFAVHHATELWSLLNDVTLAAAGLRPEDGGSVMGALLQQLPVPMPPAAEAVGAQGLYVAVATPDGAVHAGAFPFGEQAPPAAVAALLAEYETAAERLTGAAEKRSTGAQAAPARKPWWRFW